MRIEVLLALTVPLLLFAETEEEALFLRRIADFWQEKEYKIAKSQMEEFLAEYPENSFSDPLCAALGDLHLREKSFSQALNYYSKIETPEFYSRVFLNRMQCLYEMQWYATLGDECQSYLEQGPNLHASYFLAIALYHQCLNAAQEPEALQGLAERAKPLFEELFASEFSQEVAQGYAHLCFILKEYERSAQIYLDLAKEDVDAREEFLFQAALVQSEYDKELAIQTFSQIAGAGEKRAKEAAFNQLALAFDLKRYEEVAQENLEAFPEEKRGAARLLIARSLLHLQRPAEAVSALKAYIEEASVSETFHAAILSLVDTAHHSSDLSSIDWAIAKLQEFYPQDPELPKAYFSRGQILKKCDQFHAAREAMEKILSQFPDFPQKVQVLFELVHLDYQAKLWDQCDRNARLFLSQFPDHELSLFVHRYQVSSLAEMVREKPELCSSLAANLEQLLEKPIDQGEKGQWRQLLAKTYYEMREFDKASALLHDSPNDRLLAAFCSRDGGGYLKRFIELAELALSEGADLIDPNQVRFALFNAHLELSQQIEAAKHLYAVFIAGAELKEENLFWLADLYYSSLPEEGSDFELLHKAAVLFEAIQKKGADIPPSQANGSLCKLAKIYLLLGRSEEAIALLEKRTDAEAKLILAESYAKLGLTARACELFDAIALSAGSLRSVEGASACLQSARLKLTRESPDLMQIATQLKNIAIQKNFDGEPVYLEAAIEYIEVQSKADPAKKIALLNKTKQDFETRDDLLSKDYHEARKSSPPKDQMYQGYMQLMDAMNLMAAAEIDVDHRKDLHTKAKELLLQIVKEQQVAPLLRRARMYLTQADDPRAQ